MSDQEIIGWIDYESARQLRQNKEVAYVKVFLKDPEVYGFEKIEINTSTSTVKHEIIRGEKPKPVHCVCGSDMVLEEIKGSEYPVRHYCPNGDCDEYLQRYVFSDSSTSTIAEGDE